MDTDKYAALLRTLELGSLSAAAEDLGYTPSGISRMMASLEAELGFSLLNRSKNGISPTKECIRLLPQFRDLTASAGRITSEIDSIRGIESGEVVIGSPYPAYFRTLSALAKEFSDKYPGIYVNIIDGMSTHYSELIEQCKADFCIISSRSGNMEWRTIADDPMVVLVSSDHPFASKKVLSAAEIESEPFIIMYPGIETDQKECFRQRCISPRIKYSCSNTLAAYYMVEAGLGITIDNSINVDNFKGSVKAVPLEDPYSVPIGIATPQKDKLSPAARRFIEMSFEYFPQII